MEQLLYDLRLAWGNLRRRGGVSAVIVLTLAVGVACTTAMFSVVRGVLLRPLPWPDSERLAVIRNLPPRSADPLLLSQQEVRELQELLSGVAVGSYSPEDAPVTFGGRTETLSLMAAPRVVLTYPQLTALGRRMQPEMWLALRASGGAKPGIAEIREAVRDVDPEAATLRAVAMDDHVAGTALARYRFAAFTLGLFAAVALGLAVVGIYGLLSYLVRRGRREVGIRLALGARRSDIYRQVSRQGLGMALAGLVVGIPSALALTGLLESLLYGVAPTEPSAFVTTGVVLLAVVLLASFVPAHRATEVSLVEVLRSE